jgi:gamma-glutamylcyclotransferase (GGCT)/AIG2-like uncharacterized protein YtfP
VAPDRLFVYGSLLFPEVMRVLLGRVPGSAAGRVVGWRVAALSGRSYPALVEAEGEAAGMCIDGLSMAEWAIIDAFEDPVYDLRRLSLQGGGHGWAYVCADPAEALPTAWSYEMFVAEHLAGYVERCAAWLERYQSGNFGLSNRRRA